LTATFEALRGLAWLFGMLLPLTLAQRWLHREIQAILFILTRRPDVVIGIFSFLFLPGVALHEASHFVAARLLGVRTGHFSLLPRQLPGGQVRLGYVETEATDILREALIGAAPLISGGTAVALLGTRRLGLAPLVDAIRFGQPLNLSEALLRLPVQPDFWIWFYLAFAISSTMFPSAADRRGWLPVAALTAVLTLTAVAAGAGPWMAQRLAPALNSILRTAAAVFGISLVPHIALGIPAGVLRRLLSRLTGIVPG